MNYLISADYSALINGTAYTRYYSYLQSLKGILPQRVYDFAVAEWKYDFQDPRCLHDSWVKKLEVSESGVGARNEVREHDIFIDLLGAYHDRIIHLRYIRVSSHSLVSPKSESGYGDWLLDEVEWLEETKEVIHHVVFSSGARFLIRFQDILVSETKIER